MPKLFLRLTKTVSTHSRPKAAGIKVNRGLVTFGVSTHSRPKAAGCMIILLMINQNVSTHSRPKAAGSPAALKPFWVSSFNTQPPEGGWIFSSVGSFKMALFQHTAARRRLVFPFTSRNTVIHVSTHSRPKAAGKSAGCILNITKSFNTQPPEGGWRGDLLTRLLSLVSTHSRPKAAGYL